MSVLKSYLKLGLVVLLFCLVATIGFAQKSEGSYEDSTEIIAINPTQNFAVDTVNGSLNYEVVSKINFQLVGTQGSLVTNEVAILNDSTNIGELQAGSYTVLINASEGNYKAQVFSRDYVEMADMMFVNGKIYVVVGVLLIVLCGMFVYLILLNRKISKLEKELN